MAAKNYYHILGLSPEASDADIKTAYRRLAMIYHPDRNRGDSSSEERLKEINEAYDILGNNERRMAYDMIFQNRMRDVLFNGQDAMHVDMDTILRAFSGWNVRSSMGGACRRRGSGRGGCGKWRRRF